MPSIMSTLLCFLCLLFTTKSTESRVHFSGMFFAMTEYVKTTFGLEDWVAELRAMKDVGFEFVVIPHTGNQINANATTQCPNGTFEVYYPVDDAILDPACYEQKGALDYPGGTLGLCMAAAARVDLNVHLGLMFAPAEHGFPLQSDGTFYAWGQQQWIHAKALHALYGNYSNLVGFYTEIEESNAQSWINAYPAFARDYWNEIAKRVKTELDDTLKVWASPYSIGNLTRHPTGFVSPAEYETTWTSIFRSYAPYLDLVAPQDSMGAQGNSYENASDYLRAVARAAANVNRSSLMWSNVELFEVWPPTCAWPSACHGRHPASFRDRIQRQMANEAAILSPDDNGTSATLIAWEWRSCFSPYAANDPSIPFPNITKQNYEDYKRYLLSESL